MKMQEMGKHEETKTRRRGHEKSEEKMKTPSKMTRPLRGGWSAQASALRTSRRVRRNMPQKSFAASCTPRRCAWPPRCDRGLSLSQHLDNLSCAARGGTKTVFNQQHQQRQFCPKENRHLIQETTRKVPGTRQKGSGGVRRSADRLGMRRKNNRQSRDAAFIPQEASIKAYTSSLIASGLGCRCPAMINP